MSEELKRGIPKAIPIGKKVNYTEDEKKQHDKDFERILKEYGVLKEDESLEEIRRSK